MTQHEAELAEIARSHERNALLRELMPYVQQLGSTTVRLNDERCIVIDSHRENGLVLSVTQLFPYMATRGHYHAHEETLLVIAGSGQLIEGAGTEVIRAIQMTRGFSMGFGSMRSHRVVAGEDGIIFIGTFVLDDEEAEVTYL